MKIMEQWKKLSALFDRDLIFYLVSLILPVVLLPLALSPLKESRCCYALVLIACYWILEPVPIYVSALLPVILFPLLGILSSSEVCVIYMKEIIMLIIGTLVMAQAVEESRLHERIALKILLLIGTEIEWLLLGVMLSTMFMSMWIMNTAATAMMLPIVDSILKKITTSINRNTKQSKVTETPILKTSLNNRQFIEEPEDDQISEDERTCQSRIRLAFLLSICYSANIGGTGTLTGTGANMILKGLLDENYPESDEINFASWMIYSIPGMLMCTMIAWFYLWRVYLRKSKYDSSLKDDLKDIISKKYEELGPLSCSEIQVLTLFIILLLLWLTRDPKVMRGWSTLVGFDKKVGSVVPAIAVPFLLFLLPSDIRNFKSGPVLKWEKVQRSIPWGMLLLCGGGFALADAAQKSGLSAVMEKHVSSFRFLPPGLVVVIVCLINTAVTEVLTNLATTILMFPIVSEMAVAMRMNPLYVLLPLVISSSFAFMLPVGTPPNAIVFASGNIKIRDMVKPGLAMNFICLTVQMLMINSLGVLMFDVHNFPRWADTTFMHNVTTPSNDTLLNSTAIF